MTFVNVLKEILKDKSQGLTPQQIRDIIRSDYPDFYGTTAHKRNVARGHYKNLDHAVLAQVYTASRSCRDISADRSQKPIVLNLCSVDRSQEQPRSSDQKPLPQLSRQKTVGRTRRSEVVTRPTPDLVVKYLDRWKGLENYRLQEDALSLLFHQLCPFNHEVGHVLLKVSALNDFYSTHIFNTYSVAKHIVDLDIDTRLAQNDLEVVNEIALVRLNDSTKNFYSFASKYCSHHKPEEYPIFDSYVETMLWNYKKQDGFDRFAKEDLKIYRHFIKIIGAFKKHYGLQNFSLREIDIFLWLAGKEWFPKIY